MSNRVICKAFTASDISFNEEERADVSVISSMRPDRDDEVLLPSGMDAKEYNRVVLWGHDHSLPAIGKALWVKRDGDRIVAKTQYATTPMAGDVWQLVKGGFLRGKSVGFDGWHSDSREPSAKERGTDGWQNVRRVWTKWPLIEYSVVNVGSNMDSLVVAVAKGFSMCADTRRALDLPEGLEVRRKVIDVATPRPRRVIVSAG